MHRPKMRLILLTAIAGLIGLVAIVFGLVNTSNSAHATTPDGAWKLVGQITKVAPLSPQGANPTLHATIASSAKTAPLVKGASVVIKSNPPDTDKDYPNLWTVVAYKAPDLYLQKALPYECALPSGPAGLVGASTQNLYTGVCPKPVVGGAAGTILSGVSDIVVDNNTPVDLFHCISRNDVDNTGALKSAAVCFDNTGSLGNTNAEPKQSAVGEGVNPDPSVKNKAVSQALPCDLAHAGLNPGKYPGCFGPPPPPPYAVAPPAKGLGRYCAAGCAAAGIFPVQPADSLVTTSCFPDVGSSVNIIAMVSIAGAVAQLTAGPNVHQTGNVAIHAGESNAACNALIPAAGVDAFNAGIGLQIYPVSPVCGAANNQACEPSPWRPQPLFGGVAGASAVADWDGDGCTDSNELWQDKPGAATKCGDDPWNPNDVTASPDVSGSYDITAIAARQDCNPALTGVATVCDPGGPGVGDHIPGFYYDCKADIQQAAKALKARLLCYIDSPAIVVNPNAVPAANGPVGTVVLCAAGFGFAPKDYCGDGISGAPPPGVTVGSKPSNPQPIQLFDKIGAKHTELSGIVDNAQNVIKLNGCFQSTVHNPAVGQVGAKASFLGDVWVDAVINMHTGHGVVTLWTENQQGLPPCKNTVLPVGTTPPGTSAGGIIPLHIVRQAPGPKAKQAPQPLVTMTCDNTPKPNTRHFVAAAAKQYQMIYGGTVEITGAVPTGWNGRYPVMVADKDIPRAFYTIPKDEKNANPACPAAATTMGMYVPVRDSDGDNCPDKKELSDAINNTANGASGAGNGGLRDPYNSYDYFNPTGNNGASKPAGTTGKTNRVADILKVVQQYHIDDPVGTVPPFVGVRLIDKKSNTDRSAVPGANVWNLGPPDGIQRVDDILAIVKQFHHDC